MTCGIFTFYGNASKLITNSLNSHLFMKKAHEGLISPDLCHINKRGLYVCAGKGGHGVMDDIKLITTLTKIILSC